MSDPGRKRPLAFQPSPYTMDAVAASNHSNHNSWTHAAHSLAYSVDGTVVLYWTAIAYRAQPWCATGSTGGTSLAVLVGRRSLWHFKDTLDL